MLQKMDRNHDGVVTIDEFLECCRCDKAITNSMLVIHNRDNQNTNHSNSQYHPNARQHRHKQHNGDGSMRGMHGHKNSSSTFNKNSFNSHRSTIQHYHTHQTNVFGSDIKNNNIGHKVSQTKRIQLSTAAKRCKSLEKSNHGDNNSETVDNFDNICEPLVNAVARQIKDDLSANNSTQTQSTASPTLVRAKVWETESCTVIPLQHTA
jgi:hypothetical protein